MTTPVPPETGWVTFRSSAIHGLGGFASKIIPSGTRIIEYVGENISKSEAVRRCAAGNEYIFSLSETEDLDGNVTWNPARLLNHSCSPNCEVEIAEGRIWLVSIREIAAGEEITFNYGYDLEDYQNYPCRCGSPGCVGYIVAEAFFDHVHARKAGASTKVERLPSL
jgi:SET domain-containing protein